MAEKKGLLHIQPFLLRPPWLVVKSLSGYTHAAQPYFACRAWASTRVAITSFPGVNDQEGTVKTLPAKTSLAGGPIRANVSTHATQPSFACRAWASTGVRAALCSCAPGYVYDSLHAPLFWVVCLCARVQVCMTHCKRCHVGLCVCMCGVCVCVSVSGCAGPASKGPYMFCLKGESRAPQPDGLPIQEGYMGICCGCCGLVPRWRWLEGTLGLGCGTRVGKQSI